MYDIEINTKHNKSRLSNDVVEVVHGLSHFQFSGQILNLRLKSKNYLSQKDVL